MACVSKTLSVELFEKEAMSWDSLQMRSKLPVGVPKEEASGRPKRRSDRKAKRPKGEKTSRRVLKAAKLAHHQAGPNPAISKIKAKEERIATEDKENVTVQSASSRVPKQMTILTTNRLTQKLHTGIYGQGKASGRILRRKALGELKAPNVDNELQRILGGTSMEERTAPVDQKSDGVDCYKGCSQDGQQGPKGDRVSDKTSHQESATSSAVVTDLNNVMDDAPRTEDDKEEEAIMKRTANSIISSLEPEKMFQCAGYVDSLKSDLRKMLRNNNPQLYSELMDKFQQKRSAKSPKVHSHSPLSIPSLENDPVPVAHVPTIPTMTVIGMLSLASPAASSVDTPPGALMDTSNNIKAGLNHGGMQPRPSFIQSHPSEYGAENQGYHCSGAQSKEFAALSAAYGCSTSGHLLQQCVAVPNHIHTNLSHVMLNSESDPSLFATNAAPQMFVGQEFELTGSNSPSPHSLLLSPTRQGQGHNHPNKLGWDFLQIVDDHHMFNLPARPQPPLMSRLSPPKMYPQKMF